MYKCKHYVGIITNALNMFQWKKVGYSVYQRLQHTWCNTAFQRQFFCPDVQCWWTCCMRPVMVELMGTLSDAGAAVASHRTAADHTRCWWSYSLLSMLTKGQIIYQIFLEISLVSRGSFWWSTGRWFNKFSFSLSLFFGGCTLSPMSVVFPWGFLQSYEF